MRYTSHTGTSGGLIASAFFPHWAESRRRVLVTPNYFTTEFDPVGVMRHEHIRSGAPPVCRGENPDDAKDLTPYDPRSVMHYFCGGGGSKDLKFTDLDREGARLLYGLPLDQLEFVD